MPTIIKVLLIAFPIYLVIDFLWIGVLMKDFYLKEYGVLARLMNGSLSPRMLYVILAYVALLIGYIFFIYPNATSGTLIKAIVYGVLFGFVVYGVFDFTNYATLERWTLKATIIDLLWGMFVSGFMSGLISIIYKLITKN
jgi:uncharacterized membrane protein